MSRAEHGAALKVSLKLGDADPETETDSVHRINAVLRDHLRTRFEAVEDHEADVVVCGGLLGRRFSDAPHWVLAHGATGDPGHWSRTIPKLRRMDTLVVTSSSDERIVETLSDPSAFCRVERIPLGVDTAKYRPDRADPLRTRRSLGLPESTPILLTASAVNAEKNVHGAVHLLSAVVRDGGDAALAIAGTGEAEYLDYLRDLASRRGVLDRLHVLGTLEPSVLADLYAAVDIFVHLCWTWKENFGLAPVEAQASGLPVLASAWDGFRDTIVHGETGFLAPTWLVGAERRVDWPTLIGPCLQLLEPSRRERFARRARAHAVSRFDMTDVSGAVASSIERALDAAHDLRSVRLSGVGRSLVWLFESTLLELPGCESKEVAAVLRHRHPTDPAATAIHRAMVSANGPPIVDARASHHLLVDLEHDEGQWSIVDPPWPRRLLTSDPVVTWLVQRLREEPRTRERLSRLAMREDLPLERLDEGLRHLVDEGVCDSFIEAELHEKTLRG